MILVLVIGGRDYTTLQKARTIPGMITLDIQTLAEKIFRPPKHT